MSAGWIPAADLRMLEHELKSDRAWNDEQIASLAAIVQGLPPAGGFAGSWHSHCAGFTIVERANGTLRISGSGGISSDEPEFDAPLKVDGRLAWMMVDAGASDECQLAILRLNNALGVVENGQCGDRYCAFSGIFHQRRDER